MKFGVIVFPGSNCDRDMQWILQGILGQPTRLVWHQEHNLDDLDVIVVPGGFSYGDYLRCGAIARFSPAMQATVAAANAGKFVLGVCNGFQILTEIGLLPGALVRNRDLHFICDRVPLRIERTDTPWTQGYAAAGPQPVITLPIAHGEGRYHADADTLAALTDHGQILFRYCTPSGDPTDPSGNPNGSVANIAGICNRAGNVLGMMPHPERAADTALTPPGSPTPATDGLSLFTGLLQAIESGVVV
jgi:phosphoribosylformylglycinamidine synthase